MSVDRERVWLWVCILLGILAVSAGVIGYRGLEPASAVDDCVSDAGRLGSTLVSQLVARGEVGSAKVCVVVWDATHQKRREMGRRMYEMMKNEVPGLLRGFECVRDESSGGALWAVTQLGVEIRRGRRGERCPERYCAYVTVNEHGAAEMRRYGIVCHAGRWNVSGGEVVAIE